MAGRSHRTHLGPHFCEASRQLWERMRTRKLTAVGLASILGTRPSSVWRLLYGDRKAGRALAELARSKLGIPTSYWELDPKPGFIPPAARAA